MSEAAPTADHGTPASNGRPQVLIPFDRKEVISLRDAAKAAGKSESTIRAWCANFNLGRRVGGGPWLVSRAALAMFLDGDRRALEAYLSGDREGPTVSPYMARAGLR